MGESVKAWMLPGSSTSSFTAPGLGWITETEGIASSRVVSFTAAAVWMRALMPQKTKPATISTATIRSSTTRSVRPRAGDRLGGKICFSMEVSSMGSLFSMDGQPPPVQHAEHSGDEEQRGDGGANQSTDHGAFERGVLLAAFSHAQGHRYHTDDHGERGHQDGSKTCEAGFERGARGVAFGLQM